PRPNGKRATSVPKMTLDGTAVRRLLPVAPIKLVLHNFPQSSRAASSTELHNLPPGRRVRARGCLRTRHRLRLNDGGMMDAFVRIARGIGRHRPIVHLLAGRIASKVDGLAE